MSGQPEGFDVVIVIPTEPAGATTPAYVVQLNDTITLKTYMHVDASVMGILKTAIKNAVTGPTGKVEYHFQDLETGSMVPTIAGGTISKLPAGDIAIALGTAPGPAATAGVVAGDLKGKGLPATGDYYFSTDTAPITTGNSTSASKLKLPPAPSDSGTWRVLTHVHGGLGNEVSAFDDDLLIQVIA
jgi:hypothetical protein